MTSPILYRFGRVLVQVAARAYFRRVEIQRADRMPPDGPVILAANHPQSITDALILGLATPRVVHFVAHSGLFRNPLIAALLRSAGVIPIHRSSDVPDAPAHNEASFAACTDVLRRGGRAVFVGFGASEPTVNLCSIIGKQLTLMGSHVMPIHYYWDLVAFILRHDLQLKFAQLVTHRFPLKEAAESFRVADSATAGKVMLVWE